jgi:hypothetical protein
MGPASQAREDLNGDLVSFDTGFLAGMEQARIADEAMSLQQKIYKNRLAKEGGVYQSMFGAAKKGDCDGCGAPNLVIKCKYCGRLA